MDYIKIVLGVVAVAAFVIAGFEGMLYAGALSEKDDIRNDYDQLQQEYQSLSQSYASLQNDYSSLDVENLQLKTNISQMEQQYSDLQSDYNGLQGQLSSVQSQYSSLSSQYNSLQSQYTNLQSDYTSLQNNYDTLESNYDILEGNFDVYYEAYNELLNTSNEYIEMVQIRYALGENATNFVTPFDPDVISIKNSIISADNELSWNDMNTINTWVYNNIEYNHDTYIDHTTGDFYGEFWQYPKEVLENRFGDCEDFAVLMASICKAEQNVGWLFCAYVTLIDENGAEGHICVFVNVEDDKLYIYDPTWGWDTESSYSEEYALNKYITENDCYSVEVNAIFDENIYMEFDNNQEFYDFF